MTKPGSYVVNGALACGALYYALRLSASGRTGIDYAVISLVCLAIVWNLAQLSRRLYPTGGGKAVWHVQRTVLFWIIGTFNTVLLRPEHVGGWRPWVGGAMLALALADTIALFFKERRITRRTAEGAAPGVGPG